MTQNMAMPQSLERHMWHISILTVVLSLNTKKVVLGKRKYPT